MRTLPGGDMMQRFLDQIDPTLGFALFVLVLVTFLLGRRRTEDRTHEG